MSKLRRDSGFVLVILLVVDIVLPLTENLQLLRDFGQLVIGAKYETLFLPVGVILWVLSIFSLGCLLRLIWGKPKEGNHEENP